VIPITARQLLNPLKYSPAGIRRLALRGIGRGPAGSPRSSIFIPGSVSKKTMNLLPCSIEFAPHAGDDTFERSTGAVTQVVDK
jgi:hypothetical protein